VERRQLIPDVSLVPQATSPDKPLLCALAEAEVQCMAARNSTIAGLLTQEADAIQRPVGILPWGVNTELIRDVLLLNATHQRNLEAGRALELFLRLVEAEAGAQNLEGQLKEVDSMLGDITRLTEQGLLSPVPKSQIEGQRLELLHRQVELLATIQRLNQQLAALLHCDLPPGSHFWPETDLTVDPAIPDREEAAALAVLNRADIAALRLGNQASGRDSLELAQLLLPQISAGLGSSLSTARLSFLSGQRLGGSQIRSEQLSLAGTEQERSTRNETLQAISVLEARLAQIALTRQRLEIARGHIGSVEQQVRLASGSQFNLRKARLESLAVEQDLLHDVIEWKVAMVKLRQAQGLLATECGYDLEVCCPALH
jgi:hypothetical protein